MSVITGSVGQRGGNARADVVTVQTLLNLRIAALGMSALPVTGICDPETIRAIRNYQIRILAMARADGLIGASGQTIAALSAIDPQSLARDQATGARARARMSGDVWFRANEARFPNSASINDLTPGFSAQVGNFLAALRRAQVSIRISATLRNRTRAWLMHYSWRIARGEIAAADVPASDAVDIIWDHGDTRRSRAAAAEMVAAFGIAFKPSLTSNHIRGTAIDMTITWTGPIDIADANGRLRRVDQPRNGNDNTVLHAIGASYGVLKLASDPPHWSADGH